LCLVSFIYIDPFKLDRTVAGQSSTKGSRTSNSRGIGGILRRRGPRSERRILSGGCTAIGTVKEMYICMKLVCVPFERCIYREVVVQARRMRLCNIFVTMLCNSASFIAVCSTIELSAKHKIKSAQINKWKNTKSIFCRGTKSAQNAAAAETHLSRFVLRTGTKAPPPSLQNRPRGTPLVLVRGRTGTNAMGH
jgi:hypothetical protein